MPRELPERSGYRFIVETEGTANDDMELWLSLFERDGGRVTAFEIKASDEQIVRPSCCRHLAPPLETECLSRIGICREGVFDRTSERDCCVVSVPVPVSLLSPSFSQTTSCTRSPSPLRVDSDDYLSATSLDSYSQDSVG